MGGHWAELLRQGQEAVHAVNSGDDEELEQGIAASAQALALQFEQYMAARTDEEAEAETAANSTHAFALELAARLLDRLDAGIDARTALLFLTRADWNLELAVHRAVNSLYIGGDDGGDQTTAQAAGPSAQPVLTLRPQTDEPSEDQVSSSSLHAQNVSFLTKVNTQVRQAQMRQLNPKVNRDPARLGVVTPERFSITLNQINGPPKTHRYTQAVNFDWNSSEAVKSLNRWRSQRFL